LHRRRIPATIGTSEAQTATLEFTIDEALAILRANGLLPAAIRGVRPDGDGLRLTVSGGIEIRLQPESFRDGVLRLSYSSANWAFMLADKLGKVAAMADDAIRPYPFLRREGKTLAIDLDRALQGRVRGLRITNVEWRDGSLRIEA
jgi:hypothetical protein